MQSLQKSTTLVKSLRDSTNSVTSRLLAGYVATRLSPSSNVGIHPITYDDWSDVQDQRDPDKEDLWQHSNLMPDEYSSLFPREQLETKEGSTSLPRKHQEIWDSNPLGLTLHR